VRAQIFQHQLDLVHQLHLDDDVLGPHRLLVVGEKVAQLFAEPDTRERMGAAGRAFVEANKGALTKLLGLVIPLIEQ